MSSKRVSTFEKEDGVFDHESMGGDATMMKFCPLVEGQEPGKCERARNGCFLTGSGLEFLETVL